MKLKNLPRIDPRDAAFSVIFGGVIFVAGYFLQIPNSSAVFAGSIAALTAFAYFSTQRRLRDVILREAGQYRQVEELFSLFNVLQFRMPLPPMRGWALSPDLANILIGIILRDKPKRVVDLGSGVSTLVMAYALEKNGEGKVTGIDHEEKYGEKTRKLIREHSLGNADVVVAPLTKLTLSTGEWQWYDTHFAKESKEIDLVLVDGPPDNLQSLSRYPALPVLYPYLSKHACIVVDDAKNPAEREMVDRWLKEFPDFKAEWVSSEKGTYVLRRA